MNDQIKLVLLVNGNVHLISTVYTKAYAHSQMCYQELQVLMVLAKFHLI